MRQALFRADQWENLTRGIDHQVITMLHERSDRLAKLGCSLVECVLVVSGNFDVLLKASNDWLGRGTVGITDPQVDDVAAGRDGGFLLFVDLGEEIRGKLLESLGLNERGCRHRES